MSPTPEAPADTELESGVLFEFEDAMRSHGCVRVITDSTNETTFAWTAYDNEVRTRLIDFRKC